MRPRAESCQHRCAMTQTEEFIGSLHLIAASEASLEDQKAAVGKVFERILRDASATLGGDQQRIRAWVERLKMELTSQALQPRADRFADLRDHARDLIADWLRQAR